MDRSKMKRVQAAKQIKSKTKALYRTTITIFPEVPTVPSYALESSHDQGTNWSTQFFTTDPDFYTNLVKSSGYKISDVVTNQELPL